MIIASLIAGSGGQDYLSGGYVGRYDRASTMDPGIAGMVRWLDAPVPSFPWYSSSGADFYRQTVPATTFWPFREYYYYAPAGAAAGSGIVSTPAKFDISQQMPSSVYYGAGQGLPYSQYLSTMPSRTNDLWIKGPTNWTQYLVIPVNTALQLVAHTPEGGAGGFYETVQAESVSTRYKTYQFFPGYNSMTYNANQIGRHMLYFVIDNQPSNLVIVDVFAEATQSQTQPPIIPLSGSSFPQQVPSTSPTAAEPLSGDTPVTISYPYSGSFQAYVDGAYAGTGTGGSLTFRVKGGMSHMISIWDGFWAYQKDIYFEKGLPKTIYVEAV